jgi:hypothetical protein
MGASGFLESASAFNFKKYSNPTSGPTTPKIFAEKPVPIDPLMEELPFNVGSSHLDFLSENPLIPLQPLSFS